MVEDLRHLNLAVRQDVGDYFITEGLRPRLKGNTNSNLLKQEAYKIIDIFSQRKQKYYARVPCF